MPYKQYKSRENASTSPTHSPSLWDESLRASAGCDHSPRWVAGDWLQSGFKQNRERGLGLRRCRQPNTRIDSWEHWNGGASGSLYQGNVYGLNSSNSNYAGGFKGVNGSGPIIGGFAAHAPGVTTVGASVGVSLLSGPFTFGVNRTEYTNPLQLGRFWAFEEKDYVMFLGRQVACR